MLNGSLCTSNPLLLCASDEFGGVDSAGWQRGGEREARRIVATTILVCVARSAGVARACVSWLASVRDYHALKFVNPSTSVDSAPLSF